MKTAKTSWVAFVPQRDGDAGALINYFGQRADTGEYKLCGIEARKRSTPPFIETVQRDCLELIGETQSPEAACNRINGAITRLYDGDVDPQSLVTRNAVSKPLGEYQQMTRHVAALQRAVDHDFPVYPGQNELIRAAESVVSPLGWGQSDITDFLAESRDADLRTDT